MRKLVTKLVMMGVLCGTAVGCVPHKYEGQRSGIIRLRVAEAVVVGFMAYQFHNDRFAAVNRFGNKLAKFGNNSDFGTWVNHSLLTAASAGTGALGAELLGAPWQIGAKDAAFQSSVFYGWREARQVHKNRKVEFDNVMDVMSPVGTTVLIHYMAK